MNQASQKVVICPVAEPDEQYSHLVFVERLAFCSASTTKMEVISCII